MPLTNLGMHIEEFAKRVMALMPQVVRSFTRHEDNELARGTISLAQFGVLYYLSENGRCRMKDLATHLEVSPAAATGLIDRLIQQGLVRREADQADRRIVWIDLSKSGRLTLTNIKSQRVKSLSAVFGRLSESDRQTYVRILETIVQTPADILHKPLARGRI